MPPQQTNHLDLDSSTISAGGVNGGTRPSKGIEVGSCNINEIGLESFIRRIVGEIDIHLTEDCHFNLNDRVYIGGIQQTELLVPPRLQILCVDLLLVR